MNDITVKICGITSVHDAEGAVRAGADWIGINFWSGSKRYVDEERALEVRRIAHDAGVCVVGVFVNAAVEEVERVVKVVGLDRVQLHGDEPPDYCQRIGARVIRAIRVADESQLEELGRYDCDTFLLDARTPGYGGGGQTFDWSLAQAAHRWGKRFFLAGGLTPDNVREAVRVVRPWGVDVAGGVERVPGEKDHIAMREFVLAARGAI